MNYNGYVKVKKSNFFVFTPKDMYKKCTYKKRKNIVPENKIIKKENIFKKFFRFIVNIFFSIGIFK